jgi:predicted peroxiredoxin
MDAAGKKVMIVASHGPEAPDICSAPFFFGQKAAALGAQVSICFILHSALLLKAGVAEQVCTRAGGASVRRFMDLALRSGVKLYACDSALQMSGMAPEDLIDEVENLVGPNFLITHGLEADLVLNF